MSYILSVTARIVNIKLISKIGWIQISLTVPYESTQQVNEKPTGAVPSSTAGFSYNSFCKKCYGKDLFLSKYM